MNDKRAEQLSSLKQNLKSIVVSSSQEMDINRLRKDFRFMNGTHVPLSDFNYRDLNAFLREQCADIFKFVGPFNNPILIPIITQNLRHLDKLISNQKTPKQKGRKRTSIYEPNKESKENNRSHICEAKSSTPNSVSTPAFHSLVRTPQNSSKINWQTSEHPREVSRDDILSTNNKGNNAFKQSQNNLLSLLSNGKSESKDTQHSNSYVEIKSSADPVQQKNQSLQKEPHTSSKPVDTSMKVSIAQLCLSTMKLKMSENAESGMHAWENENVDDTSSYVSSESSLHRSHFQNTISEISNFDDLGQPGSSRSCSIQSSSGNSFSMIRTKKRERDLNENFSKLAERHPDGIWASEFNIKYRELFGVELNFNSMGFNSITSMCRSFPNCWRVVRPNRNGDTLLLNPKFNPEKSSLLKETSTKSFSAPIPFERLLESKTKRTDLPDPLPGIEFTAYPPNSLTIHDSIERLELPPAYTTPDAMIDIQVAEISDPTHFWYQIHGSRNTAAMYEIMEEMNKFYNSPEGEEYRMLYGAVQPGQYCAALYQNDWHRAIILKDCGTDSVKVRHIDYGTVAKVDLNEVRFLKRDWATLKAQALRGRLAMIKPNTLANPPTHWPFKTCQMFLKLVFEKHLVASVYLYDEEEKVLSMFLTDTTTNEDIHINDELVKRGVAVAYHESDDFADNAHWVCDIHTHERLENGNALTFAEVRYLDEYEIPIADVLPSTVSRLQFDESETEMILNRVSDSYRASTSLGHYEDQQSLDTNTLMGSTSDLIGGFNSFSKAAGSSTLERLSDGEPIAEENMPSIGKRKEFLSLLRNCGLPNVDADISSSYNITPSQDFTEIPASNGDSFEQSNNNINMFTKPIDYLPYQSYHNVPLAPNPVMGSPSFPNVHPNPVNQPIPSCPPGFNSFKSFVPNHQIYPPVYQQHPSHERCHPLSESFSYNPLPFQFPLPPVEYTFQSTQNHTRWPHQPSSNIPPGFLNTFNSHVQPNHPHGQMNHSKFQNIPFTPHGRPDHPHSQMSYSASPVVFSNSYNFKNIGVAPHQAGATPQGFWKSDANNTNQRRTACSLQPHPTPVHNVNDNKENLPSSSINNEGFWAVENPIFIPRPRRVQETHKSCSDLSNSFGLATQTNKSSTISDFIKSSKMETPPCENQLPDPESVNICGIDMGLYSFCNIRWISAFMALQEFWKQDIAKKPITTLNFKKLTEKRLSPYSFDMHSVVKDKHDRFTYITGFLELDDETLNRCSDVLVPVKKFVPFLLLFRDLVDINLSLLTAAVQDVM